MRRCPGAVLGVIVNPTSRRNRRDPHLAGALARAVGVAGEVASCATRDELLAALTRFRAAGRRVLAVAGGDGTLSFVLTAAREIWGDGDLPALAPLRGGTMNTVANAVGIPRQSPAQLLMRLAGDADRARMRSTHRYCLEAGGRSGFLFGVGVVPAYLEEYYRAGGPEPTAWTALSVLTRLAVSSLVQGPTARRIARPVRISPEVDGEPWAARGYLAVMAGTVEQIGLGFRPFPGVGPDRACFHLLAIHGSARAVAPRLVRVRLGLGLAANVARETLASRAVLRDDEPISYMIDGDLMVADRTLNLSIGPRVQVVWGGS